MDMSSMLLESIFPYKYGHLVIHPYGIGQVVRKVYHRISKFMIKFIVAGKIGEHPNGRLKFVRSLTIADVLECKCFQMLLQLLR